MDRQFSFSHAWQAMEETEEPFVPIVAKIAGDTDQKLPEISPSSPALRVAAPLKELSFSSSLPVSSY